MSNLQRFTEAQKEDFNLSLEEAKDFQKYPPKKQADHFDYNVS